MNRKEHKSKFSYLLPMDLQQIYQENTMSQPLIKGVVKLKCRMKLDPYLTHYTQTSSSQNWPKTQL